MSEENEERGDLEREERKRDPKLVIVDVQTFAIGLVATVTDDELEHWIRTFEHAESFGAFLDPTLWIRNQSSRAYALRLLRAARAFRREAAACLEEQAAIARSGR